MGAELIARCLKPVPDGSARGLVDKRHFCGTKFAAKKRELDTDMGLGGCTQGQTASTDGLGACCRRRCGDSANACERSGGSERRML